MPKLSYYSLLLVILISCNKPVVSRNEKLDQLANRECRAIDLRKQRFFIADEIRFSQDTLIRAQNKTDSDRLNAALKILFDQKNILLKKSLLLADTIHLQLDTLLPYADKQAQAEFTASLNSIIKKKGCSTN